MAALRRHKRHSKPPLPLVRSSCGPHVPAASAARPAVPPCFLLRFFCTPSGQWRRAQAAPIAILVIVARCPRLLASSLALFLRRALAMPRASSSAASFPCQSLRLALPSASAVARARCAFTLRKENFAPRFSIALLTVLHQSTSTEAEDRARAGMPCCSTSITYLQSPTYVAPLLARSTKLRAASISPLATVGNQPMTAPLR